MPKQSESPSGNWRYTGSRRGLFLFGWLRRIAVKDYMSKAETLRNIRILLVIHFGGEHIIRSRINFEISVERLIDHQRFASFRVRGDGKHLVKLIFEMQVFFSDKNFS